jgi:hypothetical protein
MLVYAGWKHTLRSQAGASKSDAVTCDVQQQVARSYDNAAKVLRLTVRDEGQTRLVETAVENILATNEREVGPGRQV